MVKRPCLGVDEPCTRLTDRPDHRCPTCASIWHQRRDARRGSSTARGYDAHHEKTRARLLPGAIGQPCPRCGELMLQGQALDLGHPEGSSLRVDASARADRIEHADCNRGARG
jgi:uncharacterized C2H2 Zn-finger protein